MKPEPLRNKTALIVDDATIIRMMLRKMLSKMGIEVVGEAEDGEEAVRLYEEKKPDFVTMDITMPGMDGITATRKIVRSHPRARIIIISALGQESKVREAIAAGAKDFIVKPLKEDRLLLSIRRILTEP